MQLDGISDDSQLQSATDELRLWGGYGFVYLPRGTGELQPALARILHTYDPDHLVDAVWTHGDIEAIQPGWHERHVNGWPTDPTESATVLVPPLVDEVVRHGLGDDLGANICSPYYLTSATL